MGDFRYRVITLTDQANIGATLGYQTPNVVSPPVPSGFQQTREHWLDTNAFKMPAFGTLGGASKNFLAGPSFQNVDFALMKNFRIKEPLSLQFRSEFFNIFNHTNFGNPTPYTIVPTFGQILSAYASRDIQFALKLLW